MQETTRKVKIRDDVKIIDRSKRIDVHVPEGESITLNNTASDFFRELQKTSDVNKVIEKLALDYNVEKSEIEEDAIELINYLISYGVAYYEQ